MDHFPEATDGKRVQMLVAKAMKSLGMNGENSILAQSTCPDALNHDSFAADISIRLG